ncbi:MAG: M13 family metallopeptidase [Sphingomonadaceae bacterium]
MPITRLRRPLTRALLSVAAIALTANTASAQEGEDWGSFGVQTQWVDTKADPGDDFDRYVNGLWNDVTVMPADKTRIGAFFNLRDLSEARLKTLFDELTTTEHQAGSAEARLADAYRAFMDTDRIEAQGMAAARPYLDRIYAAKTTDDIVELFATAGYESPISVDIDADRMKSDMMTLYVGQGGLGLPDRNYYLVDNEKNRDIRKKYKELLTLLLGEAGYRDAAAAAEAVYSLEQSMALEMWDRGVRRNRELTYQRLEGDETGQIGPDGILATFLKDYGAGEADYVVATRMPPGDELLASVGIDAAEAAAKMGGGLPATLELIAKAPVATWQAYLASRFLSDHSEFLPAKIDNARFAFYGTTIRGQQEQRARWKRAITAVEGQLGEQLGRLYAERHYPPEERAAMEELVANLRTAMTANLKDLAWMGPETRIEAQKKLDAFTPKIGTPVKYKQYEGLFISPETPLANEMATERWEHHHELLKVGGPVDETEWFMHPHTVNAYYSATRNEIVFPAAILQPPFFNLSADPAVNYGAIGAVIGHEIGHGFDDQGAKVDGDGNQRDWWAPEDKANFKVLQDKLGAQYATYCPFDEGKTCLNPQLTMGENIGDLGGLSLAYRAYRLSLDGKEAPVIDGFTGDQRFFMAWAQVWRSMVREQQAREFIVTDPHSPPKYRTNGIVRNFDEWYEAFGVTPDDELYLPPEARADLVVSPVSRDRHALDPPLWGGGRSEGSDGGGVAAPAPPPPCGRSLPEGEEFPRRTANLDRLHA